MLNFSRILTLFDKTGATVTPVFRDPVADNRRTILDCFRALCEAAGVVVSAAFSGFDSDFRGFSFTEAPLLAALPPVNISLKLQVQTECIGKKRLFFVCFCFFVSFFWGGGSEYTYM